MDDESVAAYARRAAANHTDWFRKRAGGTANPGELLFPEFDPAFADSQIDQFLARNRTSVASLSCWSLLPTQPVDLGARLLARGFQWGWKPHWMRLDLARFGERSWDVPGVHIAPLGGPVADGDSLELPNYSADEAMCVQALGPDQGAWHLAARDGGRVVGHVVLSVFRDDRSGGIYSCGVTEGARRRGIGAALTAEACAIAQREGCTDVLLNATAMGAPVYQRVGFASCGFGQTWWLHNPASKPQVAGDAVRFVEAVGRGDLVALATEARERDLDVRLPCGVTAVEVAVLCGQPAAADWLAAHGAELDVVSCWDLGWCARAAELLSARPELANLKRGEFGLTPLHVAVDRDDEVLARLVLSAAPDLRIEDDQFHSTARGWAKHQGNRRMSALIASTAP